MDSVTESLRNVTNVTKRDEALRYVTSVTKRNDTWRSVTVSFKMLTKNTIFRHVTWRNVTKRNERDEIVNKRNEA